MYNVGIDINALALHLQEGIGHFLWFLWCTTP